MLIETGLRCWQGEQALHVSNTDEGRDRSRLAATFFLNMGWNESQGGAEHQNLADAPGLSTEAAQALDEASHMFPWACEDVFQSWHEPREQRRDDQGAEPPLNDDGRLR